LLPGGRSLIASPPRHGVSCGAQAAIAGRSRRDTLVPLCGAVMIFVRGSSRLSHETRVPLQDAATPRSKEDALTAVLRTGAAPIRTCKFVPAPRPTSCRGTHAGAVSHPRGGSSTSVWVQPTG